jgi:hypothetical protein
MGGTRSGDTDLAATGRHDRVPMDSSKRGGKERWNIPIEKPVKL